MSKVKDTCTGFIYGQLYRAGSHKVNDFSGYKTFMSAVNDSMTTMLRASQDQLLVLLP